MIIMEDVTSNKCKVRLDPGELCLLPRPSEVETILGSCVSVVLFHPNSGLGAMSHGKFPERQCQQPNCGLKICRDMGNYVSCSLLFMLSYYTHQGVPYRELEVKLFGGAMMFTSPGQSDSSIGAIGKRNIEVAMEIIRTRHLRLVSSDIGGPWGRRIIFNTEAGEVKLQRIRKTVQELADIS